MYPKMRMLLHKTRSSSSSTEVVGYYSVKSLFPFYKDPLHGAHAFYVLIFGYITTASVVNSFIPGGKGLISWRRRFILKLYLIDVGRRRLTFCSCFWKYVWSRVDGPSSR